VIAVEIKLSEWLYNAILSNELLTISPDYFNLRKPMERRIYEIARKHCGDQDVFKIGLENLVVSLSLRDELSQ
jgi:plasmid replication initiation protein